MELWDIYDSQGNLTGKVKQRTATFEKGEYHLACSIWIINSNGEALIQKRSLSKRINPGMWSITVGSVLAGESSLQACLREVAEEVGLILNPQDITFLYRTSNNRDCIWDDYISIHDFNINDAILQPDEVAELKWVALAEIEELYDNGQFMFADVRDYLGKVLAFISENPRFG
jgi:isopentenyldiphosphate isomerase